MTHRRAFLMNSALTAAASARVWGANDRIQTAVLGTGVRGAYMATVLAANPDCAVPVVCDVYKPSRDKAAAALPVPAEALNDYRRILDRKDIDAVLIATPDHWHAPMVIEAVQAGKDAYCEKPLSNSIEAGAKAVEIANKSGRIVQMGLQQRSWEHFMKCRAWAQDGRFGKIYHAQLHWQGHYSSSPEEPAPVPEGLDWDLFQGPAERRPYSPRRQHSWRGFYAYGGGIITDQGVHLCDLVRWYLDAGQPLSVAASAQWVRVNPPNPEQPPDTYAITWKFDNFLLSFANTMFPNEDVFADHGVYFYGSKGSLHISRASYVARPLPATRFPQGQAAPPPPFEPVNEHIRYYGQPADRAHVRNFLDCVKSRQKPLTDIQCGFDSTLPLLLGVLAVRTGKQYTWNGKQAVVS